jgi:hypothetical protein
MNVEIAKVLWQVVITLCFMSYLLIMDLLVYGLSTQRSSTKQGLGP